MRSPYAFVSLMIAAAAALALAVALAGCFPDSAMSPIEVTLEPYLMPSTFEFTMGPRMVGTDADSQRIDFSEGEIEGFRFEWGYRQRVRLNRHHVSHPEMDGPGSIEYYLDKILSKEAVPDWSFRSFPLDTASLRLEGDTLRINAYERTIFIPSAQDRASLAAKGGIFMDLRVRPQAGGLVGDSVRVLHSDSTGHLVPG
ncbi:MAG: DUF4377 domain-containing protein [Fibrobacteres bacterium]|jgi:hypothetical protein|nr:DUF4377 domain-containing protein [Fibrobacterota bacterium]